MSACITGQGNTVADLALFILASIGEEAGAACHKRPASTGLPQCMDLSSVYTFADLAALYSAGIAQAQVHATSLPY